MASIATTPAKVHKLSKAEVESEVLVSETT